MSTKELSKDLWDKVVERHRAADGYENISNTKNIPWSTVKAIINKWKVYGTTKTLPITGHPFKLDDQARRRLIREANQEANGNFERDTGLYGKEWSLCACDKNIPSTP